MEEMLASLKHLSNAQWLLHNNYGTWVPGLSESRCLLTQLTMTPTGEYSICRTLAPEAQQTLIDQGYGEDAATIKRLLFDPVYRHLFNVALLRGLTTAPCCKGERLDATFRRNHPEEA